MREYIRCKMRKKERKKERKKISGVRSEKIIRERKDISGSR